MSRYSRWVLRIVVGLAFLAPLKFGTPVVIQSVLSVPGDLFEWLFYSWPNQLAVILAVGTLLWMVLDGQRVAARVDLLFWLPLVWLGTQLAALPASVNFQVSVDTVMLFAVCVLVFYAGAWYVRDGAAFSRLGGGLGLATLLICVLAFQQYFGGLEATRAFAALYVDPAKVPPELLAKLTSNRVFGTLVYPNALAGLMLVAFGPTLAWIWTRSRGWHPGVRWVLLVFVVVVMLSCLILTGSRGGFAAFVVAAVAAILCPVRRGWRQMLLLSGAVLAIFCGLYVVAQQRGLFRLGTSSLEARADYWQGAVAIIRDHPWLGTGPGTFGSVYPKYKTATTEEAQMAHNNFLQMWSDSGIVAFLAFGVLWLVALWDAHRLAQQRRDAAAIATCASLVGWTMHSVLDFDLYVPGVAIPAFCLLGALQGMKNPPDTTPVVPQGKWRLLGAALVAVCVGLVLGIQGRAIAAQLAHHRARMLQEVNPTAGLAAAQRSVSLQPHNSYYWATAGDLAAQAMQFDLAVSYYERAIEHDPYRASYHWRLARVLAAAGAHPKRVISKLRDAVELNPTNARYRQDLTDALESHPLEPDGEAVP